MNLGATPTRHETLVVYYEAKGKTAKRELRAHIKRYALQYTYTDGRILCLSPRQPDRLPSKAEAIYDMLLLLLSIPVSSSPYLRNRNSQIFF